MLDISKKLIPTSFDDFFSKQLGICEANLMASLSLNQSEQTETL
jgi:hypothetical protein